MHGVREGMTKREGETMYLSELSWKINDLYGRFQKLEEDTSLDSLVRSIFLYLGFLAVGWWVIGSLLFLLLLLLSPLPYTALMRARTRVLDLGEIIGVVEPTAGKKRVETFEEEARRRAAEANPYRSALWEAYHAPATEKTTTNRAAAAEAQAARAKEDADLKELRKRRVHIREVAGGGEGSSK